MRANRIKLGLAALTLSALGSYPLGASADARPEATRGILPASLPEIGRVDERYQSYNVESVEVTGGNFWAPYAEAGKVASNPAAGPHGTEFSSGQYQRREPIDLRNRRLRMLAKGLAPAFMRVSGSWANAIYFQDDYDAPRPAPPGYQGVLTRQQWAGVIDFAKSVDAKVLTSFAVSDGARSKDGSWNPENARRLFAFTHTRGGRIDAVELMNEPNVRPQPYSPADFARDTETLRRLLNEVSPSTLLVGPGSTGEAGFKLFATPLEQMSTMRLVGAMKPSTYDVFSHHFYGAVSERCKSLGERRGLEVTTSRADALTESWLERSDKAQAYYRNIRDKISPNSPIWITEIAQTACGGDRWASTFIDTFRYIDQLGRLAKQDVSIVFHNTLAASDYALIDDRTWLPRPSYWAALLWRRTMGTKVLDAGKNSTSLHLYAHCQRGVKGGVTIVAVNLDQSAPALLDVGGRSRRFTLTSADDGYKEVLLNGRRLNMVGASVLPRLVPAIERHGSIKLPAASISFLELPKAGNPACR